MTCPSGLSHLSEVSVEHLDEAVRVGVVVDGALVALGPAQQHQVELVVALVDQVPGGGKGAGSIGGIEEQTVTKK